MKNINFEIIEFDNSKHREQVIDLWKDLFAYKTARNSPGLSIDTKLKNKDGLFFVAKKDRRIIGTIMAGYDGHRGWIYSLAIHTDYQRQGIGSALLSFTQAKLEKLGCLKINLQIMEGNEAVQKFYSANGYSIENRISMGKTLLK